ncbi:hypothetical protein BCV69DRAFT_309757 [Microstroma glucosiphilum]|uniref:ICE2-domain-containing protein n=1 Tax=Pseudomicrostroma glucosiphilum TaxID=1684307 RepID=A0A316UF12_9BASI|nr:hypothetical protein BCV69DRAFT_309757 [Pseudomicrostroma glucosiphilum]PWN23897.1 hypothetical protein BCV69DRAFT_309757 [Pseudomicrostroma glucosiphilum]
MAITLDPSKPPLATIGRALTLVQVIFYLPLTLDVGGPDAFLALSASLASYYWCLSSLRLLTRKTRLQWIGTLFASFQFLVVPSCLAICWAVYCPPEKNYFFVRWARSASAGGGLLANHGSTTGEGLLRNHDASVGGYHPATPPHLAAIMQAITPILKSRNTHPYLEGLFDFTSASILYLARKVPTWWGTLLRTSSPVFSLLEGSATLLVIQVLGTGCRYIIATSLTTPASSLADPDGSPLQEGSDGNARSKAARPTSRYRPLSFLASIGIRGAEAWQLFFLLASAIIYVISGWSLYLSFEGVAARGGGASLMMGVSVASVAWLTAIAFGLGKGNVIETSLIAAYTAWNIFALSSSPSPSFLSDPIALVRSFKGQVASSSTSFPFDQLLFLSPERLATLPGYLPVKHYLENSEVVADSLTLIRVTFGQSLTFLSALASALPASVVVSLVYRLMVLYAASRILPFLCGPSARRSRQEQWPPRKHRQHHHSSRRSSPSSRHSDSSSSSSSSGSSTTTFSSSSSAGGSVSSSAESDFDQEVDGVETERREKKARRRSAGEDGSRRSSSRSGRRSTPKQNSDAETEPFGSFISVIISYARLILIAVYSHLLLLDQSHQAMWRFSTVSVTLGLWTMELLLGGSNDEMEFASAASWGRGR